MKETSIKQLKTNRKYSFLDTPINISFLQAKINIDFFIHLFCFISVLLIGADRWGITLLGVNFRIDQLFLCVFALLLAIKNSYRLTVNYWIIAFTVFTFISSIFAVSIKRAVLFYCSIIYNIIFLFYAFASYVHTYGLKQFISVFRYTCYVQFVVIVLQFILKTVLNFEFSFLPSYGYYMGIPRFQIWFYEPSYLATYLVFWFSVACFMLFIGKEKGYIVDIILALFMFVLSTSTSGFIGIALVFVSVYFIWLCYRITVKKLLFPLVLILLFIAFRFAFSSIYDVFIGRLFLKSLNSASGGRIEGWLETFQVFKQNPLFGVGPGNYGIYLGQNAGYVPSNVSLELLATIGLFSFIAFYGLTLSLIVSSINHYQKNKCAESLLFLACGYALLIFTIILQINQGYLRLYHWMFFGILWGSSKKLNVTYKNLSR